MTALSAASSLDALLQSISSVLLGKRGQVELATCCLLAQGHLLIEDIPGTGKSTLAEVLARGVGLSFKRVSFTSDLLPADLTGLNVFDQRTVDFRFQPGPLFIQVMLADEINRASPRTQSALLEAMAVARVSVDGTSHALPKPFFVIATQNSLDQVGTSSLPEAQLDRFLMRISLGYPDREAERQLLMGQARPLEQSPPVLTVRQLLQFQAQVVGVHCSDAVVDYVLDLVQASRRTGVGLSSRAAKGLMAAARAIALLRGRDYVTVDDVQTVFPAVAEHRLDAGSPSGAGCPLSTALLESVDALR